MTVDLLLAFWTHEVTTMFRLRELFLRETFVAIMTRRFARSQSNQARCVVQSWLGKLLADIHWVPGIRSNLGLSKSLTLGVHLRLLSFRRGHVQVFPFIGTPYRASVHVWRSALRARLVGARRSVQIDGARQRSEPPDSQ